MTSRRRPLGLGWALIFSLVGCDGLTFDVDSVQLQFPEQDSATNNGGADVRDSGADMSVDMSSMDVPADDSSPIDMPIDTPPDVADVGPDDGGGPICTIPFPLDPDVCHPLTHEGCPPDGECNVRLSGSPPMPTLLCSMPNAGTSEEGTPCASTSECSSGLVCLNWSFLEPDPRGNQCSKFCLLETGEGCDAGEFCTRTAFFPDFPGIGFCTPECDPYDPSPCSQGETCTVDWNYPTRTCDPHFRCATVSEAGMAGDSCGSGASGATKCGRGFSCYEIDIADFQCVQPCTSDSDCSGACQAAQGEWGLRYCEL